MPKTKLWKKRKYIIGMKNKYQCRKSRQVGKNDDDPPLASTEFSEPQNLLKLVEIDHDYCLTSCNQESPGTLRTVFQHVSPSASTEFSVQNEPTSEPGSQNLPPFTTIMQAGPHRLLVTPVSTDLDLNNYSATTMKTGQELLNLSVFPIKIEVETSSPPVLSPISLQTEHFNFHTETEPQNLTGIAVTTETGLQNLMGNTETTETGPQNLMGIAVKTEAEQQNETEHQNPTGITLTTEAGQQFLTADIETLNDFLQNLTDITETEVGLQIVPPINTVTQDDFLQNLTATAATSEARSQDIPVNKVITNMQSQHLLCPDSTADDMRDILPTHITAPAISTNRLQFTRGSLCNTSGNNSNTQTSSSEEVPYSQIKQHVYEMNWPKHWECLRTSEDITLVHFSRRLCPVVKMAVTYSTDGIVRLYVHDVEILKSHHVWANLKPELKSRIPNVVCHQLSETIKHVYGFHVCSGNPEDIYLERPNIGYSITHAQSKDFASYREADYHEVALDGIEYSATVRSLKCEMLIIRNMRCASCCVARKTMSKGVFRDIKRYEEGVTHPEKTPICSLTPEQVASRLRAVTKELKEAKRKEAYYLQKKVKNLENDNRDENETSELLVTLENSSVKDKLSPFQKILWEQQVAAVNKKEDMDLRWDPTILSWCRSLQLQSWTAYEALRHPGFLVLPSIETLSQCAQEPLKQPLKKHRIELSVNDPPVELFCEQSSVL